jgi:hypothetical protein
MKQHLFLPHHVQIQFSLRLISIDRQTSGKAIFVTGYTM